MQMHIPFVNPHIFNHWCLVNVAGFIGQPVHVLAPMALSRRFADCADLRNYDFSILINSLTVTTEEHN